MPLSKEQLAELEAAKSKVADKMKNQKQQQQTFNQNIDRDTSNLNNLNQEDPFKDIVKVTGGGAKPAKGGGCEIM